MLSAANEKIITTVTKSTGDPYDDILNHVNALYKKITSCGPNWKRSKNTGAKRAAADDTAEVPNKKSYYVNKKGTNPD